MDDTALEGAVRDHLGSWFGKSEVAGWKLLRIYRIPFAQPNQARHAHCPSLLCFLQY
jgi:hypothetical protein